MINNYLTKCVYSLITIVTLSVFSSNIAYGQDITVATGTTLEVSQDITYNSITVEPGGNVIVNSGVTLTLVTDITLNSSSTLYPSIISDGTIIGTVNYNRTANFVAGAGTTTTANDYVSPPLTGMTFGELRTINTNIVSGDLGGGFTSYFWGLLSNTSESFSFFDASNDGDILQSGIGYRTASTDGGNYTYTGEVETGSVAIPIALRGNGSNRNLVGNPYPSYISLSEFLNVNSSQLEPIGTAVYGYDGSSQNGWTTLNQIHLLLDPDTAITPGQGFIVNSKIDGGMLTFNPNMRTTGDTDDFILNRLNSTITNIKLDLTSASSSYSTEIYFTEFSTLGLDIGYDARIYSSSPDLVIFSQIVDESSTTPLVIQSLGETDYSNTASLIVKLGVKALAGEQVTFSLPESTLPPEINVFLQDALENTTTLLNTGDYVLTPSTDINSNGRFTLIFEDTTLSTSENTFDNLTITTDADQKALLINGQLLEETDLNIYDSQGRLVINQKLLGNESLNSIDTSELNTGVYIVQLNNTIQTKSQKVIIQ